MTFCEVERIIILFKTGLPLVIDIDLYNYLLLGDMDLYKLLLFTDIDLTVFVSQLFSSFYKTITLSTIDSYSFKSSLLLLRLFFKTSKSFFKFFNS